MLRHCSAPEEAGISSLAVGGLIDEFERRGLEPHAVMILKDGRVAAKLEWQPYDARTPHTLFSLSKSFCSCAAGFAVAEGLMTFDTPILDILPDKAPENPSEELKKITVGDLLCMGSGMDPKSDSIPGGCQDFAKYFLSCPVLYPPRTHFHYNTIGTYMVSCAVQRLTGQTCRDYLMPRLFDKIGIPRPQWDCCPQGVNMGGYGLHLSCEDIARFGQLLLCDGVWNGERVLPEGWVKEATTKKIDNFTDDIENDWQQGYCYQFWRTRGGRYRGDGMFGQICMVDEANGVVVAVTAGILDMGGEFDAINNFFKALTLPPADADAQAALQKRIANLGYPNPADDGSNDLFAATYSDGKGAYIRIEDNGDGGVCVHLRHPGEQSMTIPVVYGKGKPLPDMFLSLVQGEQPHRALATCGWQGGALHCVTRTPSGPYTLKVCFTPEGGDKAHVSVKGVGPQSGEYDMTRVSGR